MGRSRLWVTSKVPLAYLKPCGFLCVMHKQSDGWGCPNFDLDVMKMMENRAETGRTILIYCQFDGGTIPSLLYRRRTPSNFYASFCLSRRLSMKHANDSWISSGGTTPGSDSAPGLYFPVLTVTNYEWKIRCWRSWSKKKEREHSKRFERENRSHHRRFQKLTEDTP